MNYRTWRTYLADTMELLNVSRDEAIKIIDRALRDEFLEEMREQVESARRSRWEREHPVYTCRDITWKPLGLLQVDAILKQTYGPAIRAELNKPGGLYAIMPLLRSRSTRRQRLRRWIRIHRHPRLRLEWEL